MLDERRYTPKETDLLYHYCSADAFLAICRNKTIRFCDIFSMNDSLEMHWGYKMWEEAAAVLVKLYGEEIINIVDDEISKTGIRMLPLAACFSTQGDVLSQWRAYSSDGSGYCIGFKASELCQLPVRPLQVLYDREKQKEEIFKVVDILCTLKEAKKISEEVFHECCVGLACDLASFKNPAFIEESEVRLVHLLNYKLSNDFLKVVDVGGTLFGNHFDPLPVNFFMRDSCPVAYLDIPFARDDKQGSVAEVIIGPKNNSLPTAISVFLETLGIANVQIKQSVASYR